MKDKIQVEEYIRTYDGIIGKVLEDEDIGENGVYIDTTFLDDYADETNFVKYEDIKSHSFNIIDLIEEGDFIKIKDEYFEDVYLILDTESWLNRVKREMLNDYFKLVSIVTKEKFKNVEYEV